MGNFKLKKCAECGTMFKQFNSLNKYCSAPCKLKNTKPKVNQPFKPKISPVSKKQAVRLLQYSADRKVFLDKPENAKCPITGWPTTDVHHKRGRIGDLLLDQRYWVALSREGHDYVEDNPIWAKENGYSLDRLTKE